MPNSDYPVSAGVIGVGKMGENHVRTYRTLPSTELVGIYDADVTRARTVAAQYNTEAVSLDTLLESVDVVSVAVPTLYHFETTRECIDAGVHVLVEKPFVRRVENGQRLIDFAAERNVVLQVGHVERYNPAVSELTSLAEDLDLIGITARRLGPPVDRDIDETVVMDLMIHDIDVLLSLVDDDVERVTALGADDAAYASALVRFESGIIGGLTASRVTQEKVRKLTITARSCRVTVDYIEQSIEVRHQSVPEYVRSDGRVHHKHANVVEKLSVEDREPLKREIEAFVESVMEEREPVVSGEDGLKALELTQQIEKLIADPPRSTTAIR